MHFLEKQLTDELRNTEEQLFALRLDRVKYFSVSGSGERLTADPKYAENIRAADNQEIELLSRRSKIEAAKTQASGLAGAAGIKGVDLAHLLTWLIDKEARMKKDMGALEVEAVNLRQKIEANRGLDVRGWQNQLAEYEEQYKNIKSEYEKLKAAREEVFKVLQSAGA